MKKTILLLLFTLNLGLLFGQNNFSFVFLPDVHLQPDSAVEANLDKVITLVNSYHPDFLIAGGDMIYTAKNGNAAKAKMLFGLMDKKFGKFEMPVYYTMGNHEIVGVLPDSGIDSSDPDWGKGMYQKRYGKRYKLIDKFGWKFFLLDGIKILEEEQKYTVGVDSVQIDWIKKELSAIDSEVPVVVVIHTPLVRPYALRDLGSRLVTGNSKAVLSLFKNHNLKMVLQGHNHVYMNLFYNNVYYISGGSTLQKTKAVNRGFTFITVKNNEANVEFVRTGE